MSSRSKFRLMIDFNCSFTSIRFRRDGLTSRHFLFSQNFLPERYVHNSLHELQSYFDDDVGKIPIIPMIPAFDDTFREVEFDCHGNDAHCSHFDCDVGILLEGLTRFDREAV